MITDTFGNLSPAIINTVIKDDAIEVDKEIAHGKVMVPTEAYRDEGTSYHYAPAADYARCRPF